MQKKQPDRFTILAADIASPQIVAAIDKALEDNQRERTELIELRKMAVRRHGDTTAGQQKPEAFTEPRVNQGAQRESLNVATLIARYKTDKNSGYSDLRFRTREHYDSMLRRIERDIGKELIEDMDAGHIWRVYEAWAESGRISMAHALVVMLRGLFVFGADVLKSKHCRELKFTMSEMKFPKAKGQSEPLTDKHAAAIINKAHELNLHSLALAQAFQSECGLAQRDVIGEWVPESEPGDSDLHHDGMKWLRGIRWDEIGKDLVLRHPRSRDGKMLEIKLSGPLLMKELARCSDKQGTQGPIVVSEDTDLPYVAHQFRRIWREVADTVGVPKHIKNMDSK